MMATRHEDHHKNKHKAKAKDVEYDDSDEAEKDWVEDPAAAPEQQDAVTPFALTGGNYDVRITDAVADTFTGHTITVPSANLQRNNTVTVANPTPPTNSPMTF